MKLTTQITDKSLYDEKVIEVDLSGLNNSFEGTIEIETTEKRLTFTGEHAQNDFEENFGFLIVYDSYCILDASNNAPELRYLDHNHETTGVDENAMIFSSEEKASDYIIKNNWQTWATTAFSGHCPNI